MNPYPKTIVDETSGAEVENQRYLDYQVGIREVVEELNEIDKIAYDAQDFVRRACDLLVKWQAKLKEWGIE